jgi:hypothetical protein
MLQIWRKIKSIISIKKSFKDFFKNKIGNDVFRGWFSEFNFEIQFIEGSFFIKILLW